jgi:hypothetical protein
MGASRLSRIEEVPRTGPRGGTTTVTSSGMIRKNLWISHEENEALRRRAYEELQSETQIIREGLRLRLDL